MRRQFIWPVYGFTPSRTTETVASFFGWGDAADFVNGNLGERNLYIGEARYDRRLHGYRPVEADSGYAAWLAEIDARRLPIVEPEFVTNRATGRVMVMV